ncbi:MAG: hypothetical protein M1823_006302, partial [Watsoniomyces obsoletus]
VPRVFHTEMLKLQADASQLSEMPERHREALLPQHQYRHGEFIAAVTAYKRRERVGIKDPTIPVSTPGPTPEG